MQRAECGMRKTSDAERGRRGDAGNCGEITASPLPRVPASSSRLPASDFARSGFTLLEILLALGLTVLLLGTICSAINLYAKYATAGRDETERLRLARALLQKMEIDIRSIVFRDPAWEGTDEESSGEEEGDESAVEIIDTADAYTGNSVGLFGDSQTLVLHVSKPLRGLDYSSLLESEDIPRQSSDLQSVAYFLAVSGASGLQGVIGNLADDEKAVAAGSGTQGLARLEGDRLAMNLADQQADLGALAANTSVLAKEVNFLQFRYFDGLEWFDVWDSTVAEELPQAVEIILGFRSAEDPETRTHQYRLVVSLPLSEPFPPELGL